jgi:hypothetical protein
MSFDSYRLKIKHLKTLLKSLQAENLHLLSLLSPLVSTPSPLSSPTDPPIIPLALLEKNEGSDPLANPPTIPYSLAKRRDELAPAANSPFIHNPHDKRGEERDFSPINSKSLAERREELDFANISGVNAIYNMKVNRAILQRIYRFLEDEKGVNLEMVFRMLDREYRKAIRTLDFEEFIEKMGILTKSDLKR